MSIKIIVADDHRITREGLLNMLKNQPDMEVIAEAENGRKAVQLTMELLPDVVIMDVTMPSLNGIDATRMITADSNDTRVIALSMHSDKQFVKGMIQAGASGYLLKDCAFEELIYAIRSVSKGHTYLSPDIAGIVVEDYLDKLSFEAPIASAMLSTREREVLQLVAEGKKSKAIADHLNLSVKTVETHRRQLMEKLKIYSIAELTKYAIREGLTSLEK